jgi:hypothetical protein
MKQDIATYKIDSFIDYAGKEHKIIACALSESPADDAYRLKVGWIDDMDTLYTKDPLNHEIYRMVSIGVAVCNPTDTYDEEAGKKIARSKASNMENVPRIYAHSKGIITKELVDAFLDQQVKFFKENPETLIPGYNAAKANYEAIHAAQKEIDNLNDEERLVFNLATKGFDFSKYIDLAKVYVRKIVKHE